MHILFLIGNGSILKFGKVYILLHIIHTSKLHSQAGADLGMSLGVEPTSVRRCDVADTGLVTSTGFLQCTGSLETWTPLNDPLVPTRL